MGYPEQSDDVSDVMMSERHANHFSIEDNKRETHLADTLFIPTFSVRPLEAVLTLAPNSLCNISNSKPVNHHR